MNKAIYLMEIKRNFKSFVIWAAAICGMLFFGMLFYPSINTGDLLVQIEPIFETPMLKGVLSVFGADLSSLGDLMGYYVTYNSLYNLLLGCIFASILAGNMLAREEAEKTAEFLYTRPVTRLNIFISKAAALITYIFMLSAVFFSISLLSMETVKNDAARKLQISGKDHNLMIEQIKRHPEAVYEAFNLDEDSFSEYALSFASDMLGENKSELKNMNLDINQMNALIEEVKDGPDAFFESALNNPEKYMRMFNFREDQRGEFLDNVRSERKEYNDMKTEFFRAPDIFLQFFQQNPGIALSQFEKTPGSMSKAVGLLDLPRDFEGRIFKKYSAEKLFIFSVYIFFLLSAFAGIILFVSVMFLRGRTIIGPALGLVFALYFLKSVTGIASGFSEAARILSYISPFSWMNTEISRWDYSLEIWRSLLFILVTAISILAAYLKFRKKDILV